MGLSPATLAARAPAESGAGSRAGPRRARPTPPPGGRAGPPPPPPTADGDGGRGRGGAALRLAAELSAPGGANWRPLALSPRLRGRPGPRLAAPGQATCPAGNAPSRSNSQPAPPQVRRGAAIGQVLRGPRPGDPGDGAGAGPLPLPGPLDPGGGPPTPRPRLFRQFQWPSAPGPGHLWMVEPHLPGLQKPVHHPRLRTAGECCRGCGEAGQGPGPREHPHGERLASTSLP